MKQVSTLLGAAVLCLLVATPVLAQTRTYKVLATSRTGTMQKEMQDAGDMGYRFVAVMGGETAIGGKEVVVLMEKVEGDKNTYSYKLLATSRTGTLQKEISEASANGYTLVALAGRSEYVAILERAVR